VRHLDEASRSPPAQRAAVTAAASGGGGQRRTEAEPNQGSIRENPDRDRGYSVNIQIAIKNRKGGFCKVQGGIMKVYAPRARRPAPWPPPISAIPAAR
jgi:hypothetical protein